MSAGDSLILGDVVELLKGGQVSAHPMAAGARMVLTPGFDRGAGAPQTDVVASLLTDGETPKGRRTGNRTITLPIVIYATSRANLNGAKELLLSLVDQAKFSLTWTPDPQGGTRAREARIDGSYGATERLGELALGQALEIQEDDRARVDGERRERRLDVFGHDGAQALELFIATEGIQ